MNTRTHSVGYRLTRNATSTADKAPYLGIAVPVGSLAYDNILAKMIDAGTFMSAATAQYFLNAFYEFAAEEIAANAVRVNTGVVAIYPMIGGSFDSEDDTFKAPRNTLYVGATLSQEIRDAVAGIVPDFLGDETAAGAVKINSVFDLATMTNGVIDGTKDFRICGIDLTVPDGADESLTFVKKDGVTKVADIAVSETADGQRLTCHLTGIAAAIPKGTYKVRLASHGLDPTAPLTVVTKTVTLVSEIPAPPVPVPLAQTTDGKMKVMSLKEDGQSVSFTWGNAWNLAGSGLFAENVGDSWRVGDVTVQPDPDDPTGTMLAQTCSADGTAVTLTEMEGMTPPAAGTYPDAEMQILAKRDGSEDEILRIPFKLVVG